MVGGEEKKGKKRDNQIPSFLDFWAIILDSH